MHDLPILRELLIVLAVSLVVVFAVRPLRIPPTVGFLLAGVALGPGLLGLVKDRHAIEILAEIGVVLLLFTIGIKLSIRDLARLGAAALGAGALQVAATIAATAGAAVAFGVSPRPALFLGCLIALSSTAVVLRLLEDRGEGAAPHGRLALGILVFQDLAIVPMMLFLPLLDLNTTATWGEALLAMARSIGLLVVILGAAFVVLPWLFERVVRTRSQELFTLTVLTAVLGIAYLFSASGLSLALGAFLAGIVVSESRYAGQILSDVVPFRDALGSLFFVSVGMLFQPDPWLAAPFTMVALVTGLLVLKAAVVFTAVLVLGFGLRSAILTGLALAQVGEFSFVLAATGGRYGLLGADSFQRFLSVAVISMALTPLLLALAPILAGLARRLRPAAAAEPAATDGKPVEDHVIIVGAGVAGRNVARALRLLHAPHLFLELNPFTVRRMQEDGERSIYGDATKRMVLAKAGIASAHTMVVTIPDPAAVRQIVAVARSLNPRVQLIVRTRFVREVDKLHDLGADAVVAEEFVTAIDLVARVLATYGCSEQEIQREVDRLREDHYSALRGTITNPHPTLEEIAAAQAAR